MATEAEIHALLGDDGVHASWHLYDAFNETEHAYRMTEGARARLGHGNVRRAIEDLEIAQGAAERAVYRVRDALAALKTLPARDEGDD